MLNSREEYKKRLLQALPLASGVGVGITEKATGSSAPKAILAAGATAAGMYDLLSQIDSRAKKFHDKTLNAIQDTTLDDIEEDRMPSYIDRDDLQSFKKVARSYMGAEVESIPPYTLREAYRVYQALPMTKRASVVLEYYNEINPGREKVAMKAVAANVVHDYEVNEPEKLAFIGSLIGGAAKAVGSVAGSAAKTVGKAAIKNPGKALNGAFIAQAGVGDFNKYQQSNQEAQGAAKPPEPPKPQQL